MLKGVKIRKSSTANEADKGAIQPAVQDGTATNKATPMKKPETSKAAVPAKPTSHDPLSGTAAPVEAKKPPVPAKGFLGLVDYGSDEDDEW